VALPDHVSITAGLQDVRSELSDRREESKARLVARGFGDEEAPIHELLDERKHFATVRQGHDRFERGQVERPGEDAELREQGPLRRHKQLVAPGDRVA
jgi:hypothetical protein